MARQEWTGLAALCAAACIAATSLADFVTVNALRDATIYEDPTGSLANGAGRHLFAGRTQQGLARRSLLRFDLAGLVPEGATILSVELTLRATQGQSGLRTISVHRALGPWTTGSSDPADSEGQGAAATPGDCTWIHASSGRPDILWTNAGGDFATTASASADTTATGLQSWSGEGLIADIVAFLANPSENFGWFLVGDESTSGTTRRFDSADSTAEGGSAPTLTIGFLSIPSPAGLAVLAGLGVCARRRRA
jgi:hypothetical protein